MLLAKKYANALIQSATHTDELAALCVGIPKETLDLWTTRIITWEFDRKQPNPYSNPLSGVPNYIVHCSLS